MEYWSKIPISFNSIHEFGEPENEYPKEKVICIWYDMYSKLENVMEYWSNRTTLQSSEESFSFLLSHLDIRCISTYFSKLHSIQYSHICSLIHCKYIYNNSWIWTPMASNMHILWVLEVWELVFDPFSIMRLLQKLLWWSFLFSQIKQGWCWMWLIVIFNFR